MANRDRIVVVTRGSPRRHSAGPRRQGRPGSLAPGSSARSTSCNGRRRAAERGCIDYHERAELIFERLGVTLYLLGELHIENLG